MRRGNEASSPSFDGPSTTSVAGLHSTFSELGTYTHIETWVQLVVVLSAVRARLLAVRRWGEVEVSRPLPNLS